MWRFAGVRGQAVDRLAGGNPVSFVEVDGHRVVADGGGGASPTPTPTDGWAAGATGGESSSESTSSSSAPTASASATASVPQEDQGCQDTLTCVLQTAQIMTAPVADALTGGATRETREILGQDYVDEDTRVYGNIHATTNVLSFLVPGSKTGRLTKALSRRTTVLGENMATRVIPFAERTGARTLGFGATADEWAKMTAQQRWKLNDGMLRARIGQGDVFRSIGFDTLRAPAQREGFDLLGSELLRLSERGIPVDHVSPDEIFKILGRY